MPEPLNELERRVLDYLVEYLRRNTYQPSIREIGREFSIKSTKTVSELLQALANKGWIERDPARSRGVRLLGVEMRAETVSLPFYEAVGNPEPAGHFEIDRQLVRTSGAFVIAMTGDHLREEGIRHGDLLVVEPAKVDQLESGDIVLAGASDRPLARRCDIRGSELILDAVRVGELPLTLTPRQAAAVIRGRVTSVLRRLRRDVLQESVVVAVHAT